MEKKLQNRKDLSKHIGTIGKMIMKKELVIKWENDFKYKI